jgi:hypothetical protein
MPDVRAVLRESGLLNGLLDGRAVGDFDFLGTSAEAEHFHTHDLLLEGWTMKNPAQYWVLDISVNILFQIRRQHRTQEDD